MRPLAVCLALGLGASGCARLQRLVITTNPPGAAVTLVKKGRMENRAAIPGVGGLRLDNAYEDEPMDLGLSPVRFEFPVIEDGAYVRVPGVFGASQRKVCTEVVVRATYRDHYAERLIPVNNDLAEVDLVLTDRRPGAAAPELPVQGSPKMAQ